MRANGRNFSVRHENYLINITGKDTVILKAEKGAFVEVFDCRGKRVGGKKKVKAALSEIYVPLGALLKVTKI
jgi:hypothetical protein